MSNSKGRKYALVKWVGGDDHNKFTVGIDINHIKNFNYDEYISEKCDPKKVYVVEWRDKPKMDLGGWTCYNALVIAVSASLKTLEAKLELFEGMKSPRSVPSLSSKIDQISKPLSVDDGSPGSSLIDSNEETKKKGYDLEESSDFENDENIIKSKSNEVSKKIEFADSKVGDEVATFSDSDEENTMCATKSPSGFLTKYVAGGPPPLKRKKIGALEQSDKGKNRQVPISTHKDGKNQLKESENVQSSPNKTVHKNSKKDNFKHFTNDDRKFVPPYIEIGCEGSGIYIRMEQWNDAKDKKSFTALATSLLMSLFTVDVLEKSNYKGGASKISKNKDTEKRVALDKDIMTAIRITCQTKFPDSFNKAVFGRTINAKLGSVREILKRQKEKENPLGDLDNDDN